MKLKGVFLDYGTLKADDLSLKNFESVFLSVTKHSKSLSGDLIERLKGKNVAIVNKVKISRNELSACSDLRLILVAATGTDNIDIESCKEFGIAVCNVPGYGTASVAQHTIMLMLMLATKIEQYRMDVKQGLWSESSFFCLMNYPVVELSKKTLGIVGFGELGKEVARLAKAFGMKVRIMGRKGISYPLGQRRDNFETLLRESDFVTLHGLLSSESSSLMNEKAFSLMKSGSFFINTARGGMVDEKALVNALDCGHLGGAALDVLSEEPPPKDSIVLSCRHPNLIVTPHSAWVSRQARQRIVDAMLINTKAFIEGKRINRIV